MTMTQERDIRDIAVAIECAQNAIDWLKTSNGKTEMLQTLREAQERLSRLTEEQRVDRNMLYEPFTV